MSDTLTQTKPTRPKLTKDEVFDFLTDNPDFLNRNPELYDVLTPPKEKTQRGVVDFQHYMVRRLKEDRDDIIQSAREMVGTTRPRISVFMQRFRNLGLIETNEDRFLIIREQKLSAYLAQIA